MKDLSYLPNGYDGLKIVKSMHGIITAEFNKHMEYDVLVLPRRLKGDYNGVAQKLSDYIELSQQESDEFTLETFTDILPHLGLTQNQQLAATQIKMDLLQTEDHAPYLFIEGTQYGREEGFSDWHYDDANDEIGMMTRILCSYNRPSTEFLKLCDAIPEGNHHYRQKPNTQHWSAQTQDVTRHRLYVDHGQELNGTVHRRPNTTQTNVPGLLLNA